MCIKLAIVLVGARILYGTEQRIEIVTEERRNIIHIIEDVGVRYPKVVFAQGILETGWFDPTNPILAKSNNWLGMKCAKHRKTYCIGTKYGHAVYESKAHCLLDYLEWQSKYLPRYEEKYGKITSEEMYIDFLIKWKYAEDAAYKQKLLRLLTKINNQS